MVYVLGSVGALRASQIVPRLTRWQAAKNLYMYHAFGLLSVARRGRAHGGSFVEGNPLARPRRSGARGAGRGHAALADVAELREPFGALETSPLEMVAPG